MTLPVPPLWSGVAPVTELRRELPHSIELTRNARAEYQWSIKLYFEATETGAATCFQLGLIDGWLRERFLPPKETP